MKLRKSSNCLQFTYIHKHLPTPQIQTREAVSFHLYSRLVHDFRKKKYSENSQFPDRETHFCKLLVEIWRKIYFFETLQKCKLGNFGTKLFQALRKYNHLNNFVVVWSNSTFFLNEVCNHFKICFVRDAPGRVTREFTSRELRKHHAKVHPIR